MKRTINFEDNQASYGGGYGDPYGYSDPYSYGGNYGSNPYSSWGDPVGNILNWRVATG